MPMQAISGVRADIKTVLEECVKGSDESRLSFPEVVMKLMGAGVERYDADLCRAERTFYMPDGASHVVASMPIQQTPAKDFSGTAVEAAIRAIQAQKIDYKTFCDRIAAAGCVSYLVSLTGRRAIYFGRTGESLVEPFPAAR